MRGSRENLRDPDVASLIRATLAFMQPVGWVERSDTHQLRFSKMMGFAKSSTHPTGFTRMSLALMRATCRIAPNCEMAHRQESFSLLV
jgi:hypothetical protein